MRVADTNVIAFVVPVIACEGITKLVLNQINSLKVKQYRVVMIVLSTVSQEMLQEVNIGLTSDRLLVLNQNNAYLSVRNFFTSWLLVNPIMKFLEQHKARVVIAHAPYAHFVMRLVKLRLQLNNFNIKLIQYFHSPQYAQFPLNTVRRRGMNKLNTLMGKSYDDVHIFVSNTVKDDIQLNLFKHPFSYVIYNALPGLNDFGGARKKSNNFTKVPDFAPTTFLIVVPGRIEKDKGQLFFIEVLKLFIEQKKLLHDEIQVLVIGEGIQRGELEDKIKETSLSEFVLLSSVVPNAELLHWMRRADLVVLPSFFEGLPLVALEAMQTKGLLLTSDIPSFQELIEHGQNGYVFRTGDVVDCLAKMQFIYETRDADLIDLNKVAQQVEQKFSFKQHVAQLVHVINF